MDPATYPYRLLAPGPVPVPPAVLRAMSEKVLHHRTPQFQMLLKQVWLGLQNVFATKQSVQILTGTGSAAMEAAILNTLSSGEEALVVVSGKFGERWAEMCEEFGIKTHRWNLTWGQAVSSQEFEQQLRAHPGIKAVFTQACETSTATLHPVRSMAQAVRKISPGALFIVDAITAVGCMPLPMDEWEIDVLVAGSQKAFMIPTGLSFIALSERAWAAQAKSQIKKFYFNLASEKMFNAKGDTQFSTPTPLIQGLAVVLERLAQTGPERLYKRCTTLSQATRSMGEALGLKTYSHSPSASVTALATPSDSSMLRDWLEKERNITIMGGQDQLKGKILRIGHMGDVRDDDMVALCSALGEALNKQNEAQQFAGQMSALLRSAEPLFP